MKTALGIAGLAGVGGFMGYMYAGLFAISAPVAIAVGAVTFVGLAASAAENSNSEDD